MYVCVTSVWMGNFVTGDRSVCMSVRPLVCLSACMSVFVLIEVLVDLSVCVSIEMVK